MRQLACEDTAKQLSIFFAILVLIFGVWLLPMEVHANVEDTLWLSLAPTSMAFATNCELHGGQQAEERKRGAKKKGARGVAYGGRPEKAKRFESEHRPSPMRTYYLNGPALSPQAKAYALHPDGTSDELKIQYNPQPTITFKTPMGDDRVHGANNIYVIDQKVIDGVLISQSAKWLSIHHSCGWGHDYRNDDDRKSAHHFDQIPLEIVINGLWDGNFHADTQSGNTLAILVTAKGTPVKGASVTITTEKKWSHSAVTDEQGIANVQLIKDYYPSGWAKFKRTQQGRFTVTAEYSKAEVGQYNGQPYQKVHYIATFPWKYSPSQEDYKSYAFGLGLGAFFFAFTGIGIYAFRERRKKPYKGISFD